MIVQTRSEVGLVLPFGSKLTAVVCQTLLPLSVVGSTPANFLAKRQSGSLAGRRAEAFGGYAGATMTGAVSANEKCGTDIAPARSSPEAGVVHLFCGVHVAALVYDKTFNFLDTRITGVVPP